MILKESSLIEALPGFNAILDSMLNFLLVNVIRKYGPNPYIHKTGDERK